jgi:hypothetical protein
MIRLLLVVLVCLTSVARAQATGGGARGLRGAVAGEAGGDLSWLQRLTQPTANEGGNRTQASLHETSLAKAAKEMARRPEDATQADLDALLARTREHRSVWYAGPELRDALLAIAKQGDPGLRRRSNLAAQRIDLDAHMVEMRRVAHPSQTAKRRGVEIWTDVARASALYWADKPGVSKAQRFDEVLADLAAVFNGPEAVAHLNTYAKSFGRLPGNDPNVKHMIATLNRRRQNHGFAGKNLDPTRSADFRSAFNDGTRNQIFHTNFFVLLGHAAGKKDPRIVNLVNLKHELFDGGQSVPDWTASEAGSAIGRTIRHMRDSGRGRDGLLALPALIGSAFSNHPRDFAHPYGPSGPDYSAAVADMERKMSKFEKAPRGSLASKIQRGLIRLFGGKSGSHRGS